MARTDGTTIHPADRAKFQETIDSTSDGESEYVVPNNVPAENVLGVIKGGNKLEQNPKSKLPHLVCHNVYAHENDVKEYSIRGNGCTGLTSEEVQSLREAINATGINNLNNSIFIEVTGKPTKIDFGEYQEQLTQVANAVIDFEKQVQA